MLRRRLYLCGVTYRRYSVPRPSFYTKQQGHCDIGCDGADCGSSGCDGFDFPHINGPSGVFDCLSYCDAGSCDWPERKRGKKDREKYIYIPPNTRL